MGLKGRRFTDKHEDKVVEMKRSFLEFMKAVRQRNQDDEIGGTMTGDGPGVAPDPRVELGPRPGPSTHPQGQDLQPGPASKRPGSYHEIKMTPEGYPIIPPVVMDRHLSKKLSEDILRAYLTQHYCESDLAIMSGH